MFAHFDGIDYRQRYLNLIHCYVQGHLDWARFHTRLWPYWAEERETVWRGVWKATRDQRCREREFAINGGVLRSGPDDPRRFPRMLDRLTTLSAHKSKAGSFDAAVAELLTAYRNPGSPTSESQYINYPPLISVIERPLPSGGSNRYPCTVADIHARMAFVPEYDLEGLGAIVLLPAVPGHRNTYSVYDRRRRSTGKPMIFLPSVKNTFEFKLDKRSDPGYIENRLGVEFSYGLEIDRNSSPVKCRWSPGHSRRFIVEHVLLHEIGHHVQYQQRLRTGIREWLPTHIKEQFAEDYAIRFNRQRREINGKIVSFQPDHSYLGSR